MKHDYITCDKAGCGKKIQGFDPYWLIPCTKWGKGITVPLDSKDLHLCPTCYEDICAFIFNKGEEVKHG